MYRVIYTLLRYLSSLALKAKKLVCQQLGSICMICIPGYDAIETSHLNWGFVTWYHINVIFLTQRTAKCWAITWLLYQPFSNVSLSVSIYINPLNPELNPICYLLALLGAHHFLHISRIRVKSLTFRLLMSYIYIYGAPILDVSRSHTTTQHSR